jgi:hypothetical protein
MARSKTCFKCKKVKTLSSFYKHPQMADGTVNKCKECNKIDVRENRAKKVEKYRAYDRGRQKLPARIQAAVAITKKWRAADRRRQVCHNAVARAVRSGNLIRMDCKKCGSKNSLAHHENYDKPLDVMWLCQPCHKQRHKEINFPLLI